MNTNLQEILMFLAQQWFFGFMIILTLGVIIERIVTYVGRFFTRTMMVIFRGWPPSHLDADGDWPEKEETKKED